MANLPGIEYGTGAGAGAVSAMGDEAAARRKALDVLQGGLSAFGKELIRTQSQEAAAELEAGLAETEEAIASQPVTSTAAVREALGDRFDALPPHVKRELVDVDAAGVETDREEIPTWLVAGALYDKRAKDLVASASKRISGSGWQAEFQAKALEDVQARAHRLSMNQLQAMHQDLRTRQATTVADYVRAGNFAAAAAVIQGSRVITVAEKEQALGAVERARQVRPYDDLVLAGIGSTADVLEAGKLIGRLESGEGLDQVDEKERIERKRELQRLVAGYERESAWQAEHQFDALDGAAQDTIVDALVKARGRPLSFGLVPPRGQASPKMREHLYRIIEGTQKQEGGGATDPAIYDYLNRLARDNPRGFVDHDILQYVADGRLELQHFTRFSDLQRSLKTEGAGGVRYQSFVGPQEETDRLLLERGVQVRGERISDDHQRVRGYIHRAVDDELWRATVANGGQPLELDRRNTIIQAVVGREWRKKGWFGGGTAPAAEVDPQAPDAGLRRAAVRLGRKTEGREYAATVAGYEAAVPTIDQVWKRGSAKPLAQADAIGIYELAERERARIEAGVAAAKRERGDATPVTDAERLAAAVQLYRGGMR